MVEGIGGPCNHTLYTCILFIYRCPIIVYDTGFHKDVLTNKYCSWNIFFLILLHGCWELKKGSLDAQYMSLTTKNYPQPTLHIFFFVEKVGPAM